MNFSDVVEKGRKSREKAERQAPHKSKPPAGFSPIPGSKRSGERKRVGDHWQYWYPSATGHTQQKPHRDDKAIIEAHEAAEAVEKARPAAVRAAKALVRLTKSTTLGKFESGSKAFHKHHAIIDKFVELGHSAETVAHMHHIDPHAVLHAVGTMFSFGGADQGGERLEDE